MRREGDTMPKESLEGAMGLPFIIPGDVPVWNEEGPGNLVEVNWGRRSGFVQVGVCEALLTPQQRSERESAHFAQLDQEGVRALINTLRRASRHAF